MTETFDRTVRAGDSWAWLEDRGATYPAGTWTLKLTARNAAGGFEIACGASGWEHLVDVPWAETAQYPAGDYEVTRWVESGATRITIDVQRWRVLPNPRAAATTAPQDGRSHVKRTLDALEAMLEGKATRDQQAYQIGGTSVQRMTVDQLLKWRDKYRHEYAAECAADKLSKGLGGAPRLMVRM
jgi:hypothetical protein